MKILSILLFLALFIAVSLPAQNGNGLSRTVESEQEYLQNLYLDLHQSPELSFYEFETAERMAQEMSEIGLATHTRYGGTGVVGVMTNGEGPTVLIRADMDALPLVEATGLDYASTVATTDEAGNTVGVMHACGHDIHMTVLIGTARVLHQMRSQWSGTVVLIAQPAEERSGGAKAMLADGLFEEFPVPDYALALHVNATLQAGTVGYCGGYMMANVDMMDITVYGEGGHGAYPETTKDPVVLASRIVMGLQTIVSREISALEPAVVTVGAINGGTKGNIIPGEVTLQLTMRSYSNEVRQGIIDRIERICKGVAISAGLSEDQYPKITLRDEYTPSVYNDPELNERIANVFRSTLGEGNVVEVGPSMVGEDFGRFGRTEESVPIMLYWLGAVPQERIEAADAGEIRLPSLHSAYFYPDYPTTIETGVRTMVSAALELLKK